MRLIVCLDDRNGMLFGGRRQSRDCVVCEKIIALTKGYKLWMNVYSSKLFADESNICVDEMFLEHAQDDDYCFTEDQEVSSYADKLEKIVVFKWNRHYPADKSFPLDLTVAPWKLVQTEEFPGNSHEKITMEVYTR